MKDDLFTGVVQSCCALLVWWATSDFFTAIAEKLGTHDNGWLVGCALFVWLSVCVIGLAVIRVRDCLTSFSSSGLSK